MTRFRKRLVNKPPFTWAWRPGSPGSQRAAGLAALPSPGSLHQPRIQSGPLMSVFSTRPHQTSRTFSASLRVLWGPLMSCAWLCLHTAWASLSLAPPLVSCAAPRWWERLPSSLRTSESFLEKTSDDRRLFGERPRARPERRLVFFQISG